MISIESHMNSGKFGINFPSEIYCPPSCAIISTNGISHHATIDSTITKKVESSFVCLFLKPNAIAVLNSNISFSTTL